MARAQQAARICARLAEAVDAEHAASWAPLALAPASDSLECQLLAESFAQALADTAPLPPERLRALKNANPLETERRHVSLPVLAINERQHHRTGAVADLSLWCLPVAGPLATEESIFVRAPGSFLFDLDEDFKLALRHAQDLLLKRLGSKRVTWRIVWDLSPRPVATPQRPYELLNLRGGSAGAAFAAAALALIEEAQTPAQREQVKLIDWELAAITARLVDADGALGDVELGVEKPLALLEQDLPYQRLPALFLYSGQVDLDPAPVGRERKLPRRGCDTLDELMEALVEELASERLHGRIPDVLRWVRSQRFYDGFTGRQWLTEQVNRTVDELKGSGVVVFEAPMGFGKTAWSLQQIARTVAQAEEPDPTTALVRLDGWVVARRNASTGRDGDFSADPGTLVRQLNACTRRRLALEPYKRTSSRPDPDGREQLKALLKDCADLGNQLGRNIVLLFDAVDEVSFERDVTDLLPDEWPVGRVVLLLVGRSPGVGTRLLQHSERRPVRRIAPKVVLPTLDQSQAQQDANVQDIRQHVQERAAQIANKHLLQIDRQLLEHIVLASQGLMVVASGLLRESDHLQSDLQGWQSGKRELPQGPKEYFKQELDRALAKVRAATPKRDREKLQYLATFVLGLVATMGSRHIVKVSQFERVAGQMRDALDDKNPLAKAVRQALQPRAIAGRNLLRPTTSWSTRVSSLLHLSSDLFGVSGDCDDFELAFVHEGLRESVLHNSDRHILRSALHATWGVVCESCFAEPNGSQHEELLRYALVWGPRHLARASSLGIDFVVAAANRLLDIRPDNHGYLNHLFGRSAAPTSKSPIRDSLQTDSLWQILLIGINHTLIELESTAASSNPRLSELLTLLMSLRNVLSSQHLTILEGTQPLAGALYNGMAGRWSADTPWGALLRRCAAAVNVPWIRWTNPPESASLQSIVLSKSAAVNCIAASADGEYIAVGLRNGETWVWSRLQLSRLEAGTLALRHTGFVVSVAIISSENGDSWTLASGGYEDATVRVISSDEVANSPRGNQSGRVALRFDHGEVTAVKMITGGETEPWWLAAAATDGTARVTCPTQLRQRESDPHYDQNFYEAVATNHGFHRSVTCLALVAGDGAEHWWLASGGSDGQTRLMSSSMFADRQEGAYYALGLVATRHSGGVSGVDLILDGGKHDWWLLSAGGFECRVTSSNEVLSRQGDFGNRMLGHVVALHDRGGTDSCAFIPSPSPSRLFIASAGGDGTVRIASVDRDDFGSLGDGWKAAPRIVAHHERDCTHVLALPSVDGCVRVAYFCLHDPAVRVVSFDPHEAEDTNRRSLDAIRHTQAIRSAAIVPVPLSNEWWIVSGGEDCTVRANHAPDGKTLAQPADNWSLLGKLATRHAGTVKHVAFARARSEKDWWLASGGRDGCARLIAGQVVWSTEGDVHGQLAGQIVTRAGDFSTPSVALIGQCAGAEWWLASTANFATRIACSTDIETSRPSIGGREVQGKIVALHDYSTTAARPLSFLPTHSNEQWSLVLASRNYTRLVGFQGKSFSFTDSDTEAFSFEPGRDLRGNIATCHMQDVYGLAYLSSCHTSRRYVISESMQDAEGSLPVLALDDMDVGPRPISILRDGNPSVSHTESSRGVELFNCRWRLDSAVSLVSRDTLHQWIAFANYDGSSRVTTMRQLEAAIASPHHGASDVAGAVATLHDVAVEHVALTHGTELNRWVLWASSPGLLRVTTESDIGRSTSGLAALAWPAGQAPHLFGLDRSVLAVTCAGNETRVMELELVNFFDEAPDGAGRTS